MILLGIKDVWPGHEIQSNRMDYFDSLFRWDILRILKWINYVEHWYFCTLTEFPWSLFLRIQLKASQQVRWWVISQNNADPFKLIHNISQQTRLIQIQHVGGGIYHRNCCWVSISIFVRFVCLLLSHHAGIWVIVDDAKRLMGLSRLQSLAKPHAPFPLLPMLHTSLKELA